MTSTRNPSTGASVVLEAIDVSLRARHVRIVEQVSLSIHEGELLGLIGPNGSGKSSLLRMLCGVTRPHDGSVRLHQRPLTELRQRDIARHLAFVSQLAETQDAITVRDAVELGRTPWLSALQPFQADDHRIVDDALNAVGMGAKADGTWHTLSGGERQRVHIARALAQTPRVLLLDEPTNHLDVHQQLSLMQLIRQWPITRIVALHDLNQAMACDRLAVMCAGKLVALGPPAEVLTAQLLEQVFQVHITALTDPEDGSTWLRFKPIPSL
ncbi:ABC transporter ATP-binding protein [Diaphorobacter caeni]|uniref:ABC transporter ATP-binding protein n=1 Tax=Diaphorobacter caeni TaxID=2784387 RepID=UPI00189008DE|nr:ABC transporter ATP-binding protein [Diaphorobacter caeni]MBF5007348.1 ABC transporter ATP-binding protein [Diaphorobacter caeni]